MALTKKSVLIIGGGFAGLSAAVFLDQQGFAVTLYEKKNLLGGRAYAFQDKVTGDWVDNGQHLLMGAYHETLKFLANIGATHQLAVQSRMRVPLISTDRRHLTFTPPPFPVPLGLLVGLLKMRVFRWKDKIHLLKMGRELLRLKKGTPKINLDQSVDRWLDELGQSKSARENFWDLLVLAALNDDPSVVSARMLAPVLVKGFLSSQQDGRMILPKENLNDLLANPARAYLELRGQTLTSGTGVKKIHVLDHKVQGVELDTGEIIKADIYISAVPFGALLRLLPDGFVDFLPYFARIKSLKTSPILSINLWFDRDVLPYDFVGSAGTTIHWYFNKNRIRKKLAPPFHVMGVKSGAYDVVESSKEEILRTAVNEFHELFPKSREAVLIHSLVNKEREATMSPMVGSEEWRPPQKSPFDNFYVIGDWTATGLPATIESAVLSARMAVDEIRNHTS